MSRLFIHSIAGLTAVCVAIAAIAQVQMPVPADPPATRDNKDTPAGVSVPDSPGAVENLAKARDKEAQKQWKIAAEFYQEALNKYSARVVPVKIDHDSGTYLYSGLAAIVQERIARWPVEGLTVYRNLYGHIAADLLASAKPEDVATLRSIFSNYFVTDAGKTAGIRLIDSDLESGDFAAAAWVGDRLLTLHPSLGGDWGMILYRTAIARHWSGDNDRAMALLDQLRQKNPNETGSLGGKDVLLADAIATALKLPAPKATVSATAADVWPRFNGIDGRGEVSPSTAKPGATLTSIPLAPPEWTGVIGNQRTGFEQANTQNDKNFLTLGVMPVVDGGSLFFQDGRCVYAVNADTGIPLPGWASTYGGDHGGHYHLSVFGRANNEQLTLAVTPSAVLAVIGQANQTNPTGLNNMGGGFGGMIQPGTPSTVKLVCLDRETGRELWTRSPSEFPESVAALRTADFVGTPLVIPENLAGHRHDAGSTTANQAGDSVLVVARGGKEQQFDDCYLVSLSLKTGQFQWSTYLGSGTRGFETDDSSGGRPSQLALGNGRVFVMTNLGSVAAVDPSDGRVIWLSSYDRDVAENLTGMKLRGRGRRFNPNGEAANGATEARAWAHNPVFVNNGHVFIMPGDAKKLMVFDAGSGAQLQSIVTADYGDADVLLGVRDAVRHGITSEVVALTSQRGLFVVDWKKYNHDDASTHQSNPEDHTDPALWADERNLSDPPGTSDPNTICGRGFLTADSVYIPTRDRLYRVQWPAVKIGSFYPAEGTFNSPQGPGNVLVSSQNVIIAGATQVDVYTQLDTVRARYEQKMAAAPTDPGPRIEFAIILDSGGHSEEALARVDEAINLAGGLNSMRHGDDRTMIFNTLLGFAQRIEKMAVSEKDPTAKTNRIAFADQLFDRASAAADSPADRANYRLDRAQADHENHDYANEVKLCQEVLSDEALRSVVISENSTAGGAAEAEIGVAIDLDRSVYRPIEALAKEAKDKALAANDPEQLLAVAVLYPNSHAATDARQAAVDRYEAAHQPARAIDILRQMYATTGDPSVKADRLQEIANDFLAQHDIGPALDRLAKAARLSPDPVMNGRLDMPDGSTLQHVPYSKAIDALRQIEADAAAAKLPDFRLGAASGSKDQANPFIVGKPITGINAVAHPLRGYNRSDQILAWSAGGLSIYPVGQTRPLSTIAEVKDVPQGAAWTCDKWIVWTNTDLFEISGEGKLDWTMSVTKLPTLLVMTRGEAIVDDEASQPNDGNINNMQNINGQVFVQGQLQGQVRFIVRPGGVIQRVMAPAGVAQVPAVPEPGAPEQVVSVQPAGASVVVSTSTGRILAVNIGSGQVLWQTRAAERAVDELQANAHFTVVRLDDAGGSEVAVYDTRTGRVIGRRKFGIEGTPNQLVNVALSEEATLAFTLLGRVQVKDLYEPWKNIPSDVTLRANQDNTRFDGLNGPDQLLVAGGRLVCLYAGGHTLRGFDLSKAEGATLPLNTSSNSTAVWMQLVGSKVFVVRTQGMRMFDLDDPDDHDIGPISTQSIPSIRTMLLGKDEAILLDERNDRGPAGSPNVRIMAFSRAIVPGKNRESGNFNFDVSVSSSSGITDWLAADGGIYYLSKDGKLHFLRGGRE